MCVIDWKMTCGRPIECSRSRSKERVGVAALAMPTLPSSRLPGAILIPGRRIMDPTAAEHRGDDAQLRQLAGLHVERISVEDDEVGGVAGEKLPAPALVARQPRGIDARSDERLLQPHALLRMPRRPLVDRAQHACADAGPGIQLLDRSVASVGEA